MPGRMRAALRTITTTLGHALLAPRPAPMPEDPKVISIERRIELAFEKGRLVGDREGYKEGYKKGLEEATRVLKEMNRRA